ncbi:tetratricopeptide repeat protein [Geitlerinema sp. PCC 9228]|uniref:tetratricopeptide repeat protein n=1 Tax=Geitlerinema sp. PCC 9228 TaxID=111611 RepID=UPI0008F99207|nr:tetratricopeptide repeat protein [Geitlerinema sp. PCC 9228]
MADDSFSISQTLSAAQQQCQSGNWQAAQRRYQQVLERDENQVDAWFGLGVVAYFQGNLSEAAICWQKVLAIDPQHVKALANLGLVYKTHRKYTEAIAKYQQALQQKPNSIELCNQLGSTFKAAGDTKAAMAQFRRSLAIQPNASAYNHIGQILVAQGKIEEGIAYYRQALQLQPNFAEARNNLGIALAQQEQFAAAIDCFQKALTDKPEAPEIHNNIGNTLQTQGQLAEAIAAYQKALQHNPQYEDAWVNLGNTYKQQQNLAAATESYTAALQTNPHHPRAHMGLAAIALLQGNWLEGFAEYEWRAQLPSHPLDHRATDKKNTNAALWDGSPLAGRTLFVYPEQGWGDTIQFVRYLPILARQGAELIFECPDPLRRLFSCLQPYVTLISPQEDLPAFDLYVPLMGLPHRLGTTLETVPNSVPYLEAPTWQGDAVFPSDRLKVGVVWAGNPENPMERRRSVPWEDFRALASIPGVVLYSLQTGVAAQQVADVPETIDLGSQFADFADTAAAIAQLDLVISIDTAVAHLAGALGQPVWLLLPFAADWRWLLHRRDSPWYPTMRLFRQPQPGDWASVWQQVTDQLAQMQAASDPAPRTSRQKVGLGFPLSLNTAWGLYGLHLTLQLICDRENRFQPVLLQPAASSLSYLHPLYRRWLYPFLRQQQQLQEKLETGETIRCDFPVLYPLGNQLETLPVFDRIEAAVKIGVLVFEDTQLSAAAWEKAQTFDWLVVSSHWNRQRLQEAGISQVRTIHEGIDRTVFHPAPPSNLLSDRFVVFSGGKLEYRKGQDLVIAAFKAFRQRHPEAILMVAWHNFWPELVADLARSPHIVGVPEIDRQARLAIAPWLQANGIPPEAVVDVGTVPNPMMGQILRTADAAIFPSRAEGGTNQIAKECLACGVPTILSANTGHLDLIRDDICYPLHQQSPVTPANQETGVEGWGESDIEEMVEQLEQVYSDRAIAQAVGIQASQAMQDWSWEKPARHWKWFLNQVVGG